MQDAIEISAAELALQDTLGYVFQKNVLLRQALTHRSFSADNNERLEFLGDAVLDTIVAQLLYTEDLEASEGHLTSRRAFLVNGRNLAQLAQRLSVTDALFLGRGEQTGDVKASILEDAFEALVGAVFLDAGYEVCFDVFSRLLRPIIDRPNFGSAVKDSKTQLQEIMQASAKPLPNYQLVKASGPDHARIFEVSVEVSEPDCVFTGSGKSRKLAEQDAASQLLAFIERSDNGI